MDRISRNGPIRLDDFLSKRQPHRSSEVPAEMAGTSEDPTVEIETSKSIRIPNPPDYTG